MAKSVVLQSFNQADSITQIYISIPVLHAGVTQVVFVLSDNVWYVLFIGTRSQ